jgi:hypothetical protein
MVAVRLGELQLAAVMALRTPLPSVGRLIGRPILAGEARCRSQDANFRRCSPPTSSGGQDRSSAG